jgi:mttA/Hcf106 family
MIFDSPMDCGLVVLIALILFGGKKIPELMRKGPPGGPQTPTHPLPVTSPIETSRGAGDPDKPLSWFFRPGRPK